MYYRVTHHDTVRDSNDELILSSSGHSVMVGPAGMTCSPMEHMRAVQEGTEWPRHLPKQVVVSKMAHQ